MWKREACSVGQRLPASDLGLEEEATSTLCRWKVWQSGGTALAWAVSRGWPGVMRVGPSMLFSLTLFIWVLLPTRGSSWGARLATRASLFLVWK